MIQDWIHLATSQDKSRPALNGIYRDTDHIVATDGHRLHVASSPKTETPGYLDPSISDEVFPAWQQVITTSQPKLVITGQIHNADRKKLSGLMALIKAVNPGTKHETTNYAVRLDVSEGCDHSNIRLTYDSETYKCNATISLPGTVVTHLQKWDDQGGKASHITTDRPRAGINLKYLLDALTSSNKYQTYSLSFDGRIFQIEMPGLGKAYIMPVRI